MFSVLCLLQVSCLLLCASQRPSAFTTLGLSPSLSPDHSAFSALLFGDGLGLLMLLEPERLTSGQSPDRHSQPHF